MYRLIPPNGQSPRISWSDWSGYYGLESSIFPYSVSEGQASSDVTKGLATGLCVPPSVKMCLDKVSAAMPGAVYESVCVCVCVCVCARACARAHARARARTQ